MKDPTPQKWGGIQYHEVTSVDSLCLLETACFASELVERSL